MATTEAQALLEKARATPKPYTVGSGYTVDTSAYAGSTDPNAVALKSYDNQLNAYKTALQAAYDSQAAANLNAQNKLKSQYDAARSNVYTNNRLSAIGNNERLAALGLAGNLYDYARSGTSETNRIAQDIAMRKSLSALDQGQADAYGEYQLALLQAQKEADMNYANKVAEVEAAKIPYQVALAQALATVSSGVGSGGSSGGSSRTYAGSSSKKSSSGGSGNSGKGAATYDSSNPTSFSNKDIRDTAYALMNAVNYQTKNKEGYSTSKDGTKLIYDSSTKSNSKWA